MKTKQLLVWVAIVVSLGCGAASRGATFSDFEEPKYTNGTNVIGLDGWSRGSGAPAAVVTPDPKSGYLNILEGTQSMFLGGGSIRRGWCGLESSVAANGLYVSVLLQRPDGLGPAGVYLSDDLQGGSTPAGIELDGDGNLNVFASSATKGVTIPTGVFYEARKAYRLGMLFNFEEGAFTAFSENVTDAEPAVNLGTHRIAGPPIELANLKSKGGLFVSSTGGVTIFDDFQVRTNGAPTSSTAPTRSVPKPGAGTPAGRAR
jgi:hypothetical protein